MPDYVLLLIAPIALVAAAGMTVVTLVVGIVTNWGRPRG